MRDQDAPFGDRMADGARDAVVRFFSTLHAAAYRATDGKALNRVLGMKVSELTTTGRRTSGPVRPCSPRPWRNTTESSWWPRTAGNNAIRSGTGTSWPAPTCRSDWMVDCWPCTPVWLLTPIDPTSGA